MNMNSFMTAIEVAGALAIAALIVFSTLNAVKLLPKLKQKISNRFAIRRARHDAEYQRKSALRRHAARQLRKRAWHAS